MRWVDQRELLPAKAHTELVVFGSREVQIGCAFLQLNRGNFAARAAQGEFRKFRDGSGGNPQGPAVFKFNFGPAIIVSSDLHTLSDWKVQKCLLISLPAINLDITF